MTFKAARCPTCGGDLQVPDDRDVIKCMYCGSNIVVRQAIQAAAGGNLQNWMVLAKAASEAGNNQEAYEYYTRILEQDPSNWEAWSGKAEAAGWMSTLASFRLPEMLSGFQKAIDHAPPDSKDEAKRVAAMRITDIISAYYKLARAHLLEYISLSNTWTDYLVQCDLMMTGLETARTYWPEQEAILDYLIYIYRDNIHGVAYTDQYAPYGPVQRVATLSPEYETKLRSQLDFYIDQKRQLNPDYDPGEITKAKISSCFVITATMGRSDHPDVVLLRRFRDEWLLRRRLGQTWIRCYEDRAPSFARVIRCSRILRFVSYLLIVSPAAWVARTLLKENRTRI